MLPPIAYFPRQVERSEASDAILREREAAAAARGEANRVVEHLSEQQAVRHIEEMEQTGAAMQRQLASERETFLTQLIEHKELHTKLVSFPEWNTSVRIYLPCAPTVIARLPTVRIHHPSASHVDKFVSGSG